MKKKMLHKLKKESFLSFIASGSISELDQTPKILLQARIIDPATRFLNLSTYFCLEILSKTWQPS